MVWHGNANKITCMSMSDWMREMRERGRSNEIEYERWKLRNRGQKYSNEMKAFSCECFSENVAVLSDFGEAVSAIWNGFGKWKVPGK